MRHVIDEHRPKLFSLWKLSELEQTSQDEASSSTARRYCVFLKSREGEHRAELHSSERDSRKYQNPIPGFLD